jgi:hypothetical protein
MSTSSQIKWHIAGEEEGSCNCTWGYPCQFNALLHMADVKLLDVVIAFH